MKTKKIMDSTGNRKVFNRVYKRYLEHKEIHCSYCKFHRGENDTRKWYGGRENYDKKEIKIRYPNWKLVSKNRKQWMKKPMVVEKEKQTYAFSYSFGRKINYIEIKFKRNCW